MSPYEILIRRLLPRHLADPNYMCVVLVCGGRDYGDRRRVFMVMDMILGDWRAAGHADSALMIVHGGARGADALADAWARSRGITVRPEPADWNEHGKAAGVIRNAAMLRDYEPALVVAFKGGNGTAHMMKIARAAGVKVEEY